MSNRHLYLVFTEDLPHGRVTRLETNPNFVSKVAEDGYLVFKFKIPIQYLANVVKPFLEGRYSEIDKVYLKNFPPNLLAVVNKATSWRNYWEKSIGVPLPKDAEVWSTPTKKTELWKTV